MRVAISSDNSNFESLGASLAREFVHSFIEFAGAVKGFDSGPGARTARCTRWYSVLLCCEVRFHLPAGTTLL
jgi:hypothetical protein